MYIFLKELLEISRIRLSQPRSRREPRTK